MRKTYSYVVNQNDSSKNFTITVPKDLTSSKQELVAVKAKTVFKIPVDQTEKIEDFEVLQRQRDNIFTISDFNSLVQEITRMFIDETLPEDIYNHFRNVVKKTKTIYLLSSNIKNQKLSEHVRCVLDMRSKLKPFWPEFDLVEYKKEHNIRADILELKFACLAISSENRARTNAFAFYHTGGKSGTWRPIPINPTVSTVQQYLDPKRTVVVGTELFYLNSRTIYGIDLFDKNKKRKFINIPNNGTHPRELLLVRSNNGIVFVLDRTQNQYCNIIDGAVTSWAELQSIKQIDIKQNIKSSLYTLVKSDGVKNIVMIPPPATDEYYTVSDFYVSKHSIFPKAYEMILIRDDPSNDLRIWQIQPGYTYQPGFIQFSLGALNRCSTRYLLIDFQDLNHYIAKTTNETNG